MIGPKIKGKIIIRKNVIIHPKRFSFMSIKKIYGVNNIAAPIIVAKIIKGIKTIICGRKIFIQIYNR